MKKKEIESMLSTDVPFKASDSLKGRIMEKAAREEPAAVRARSWKWARWAMPPCPWRPPSPSPSS